MVKKSRTKKDRQLEELEQVVRDNAKALAEGPKKKSWTIHDLKAVKPLNFAQKTMFETYFEGTNIIANGSAGTGKSYVAVYLALTDILSKGSKFKQIIIVRSAVPSREIGHLPGSIEEKMDVYESPYKDIFADLLKKKTAYDSLKEIEMVRFMPTSFVRGLTWDDAIIIVDEAQSYTFHELNSVITRLGDNSKLIICGDIAQNDLIVRKTDQSGFDKMLKIAAKMDEFSIINFTRHDIIRSSFVKSWICATEDHVE